MAIEGTIKSLYSDFQETKAIFPRTKIKAVSDDNNIGLDALLAQMNDEIDKKASEAFVTKAIADAQDDIANIDFPVESINGKTGHITLSASDVGAAPAGEYATETFVQNKIAEAQLDGSDVDLSGYASKDSIGTNKVFNKLSDIGITTFPTNMNTVARSMPNNSTLMLDSRDIISGGSHEISDLGTSRSGMYMIMRGNSSARVALLQLYGTTNGTGSSINIDFGFYAVDTNSVYWNRCVPATRTVNGKALSSNIALSAEDIGITGGVTTALTNNFSTNRAIVSNANGKLASSTVTKAELEHLSGVTAPVQKQLNLKVTKEQLWKNASLSSSFNAQTISLDLSGYDGVEILFYADETTNVYQTTGFIPKGLNSALWYTTAISGHRLHREFTATNTGVSFITATNYSGNVAVSKVCIPYIIYGIKGVS